MNMVSRTVTPQVNQPTHHWLALADQGDHTRVLRPTDDDRISGDAGYFQCSRQSRRGHSDWDASYPSLELFSHVGRIADQGRPP